MTPCFAGDVTCSTDYNWRMEPLCGCKVLISIARDYACLNRNCSIRNLAARKPRNLGPNSKVDDCRYDFCKKILFVSQIRGANVSTWPLSTPSQRLVQMRRRKEQTRDDMFAELMQSSRTDRAQLNAWRQTVAESHKALQEHEERSDVCDESRQDAVVKLIGEQTDMLHCMVDLMWERQQDHRLTLQPLSNCPPSFPSSIASSPRCPKI
ncbi:uncharacterized protein LOC112059026 isoform X2 [Chrysemys picta bellii]|uniref:uncharacterized protein LOC112059026 isoform X2 n=1 Tax=Chrysemys picta bellii TaxID=8478 RepID=UPI0032B1F6F7